MITTFGSLYAGHVDLDNLGLDGTPVNDRWLPDERLVTVFDKATDIALLMERTGYDVFWLAEHHFQREGYEVIPNILMLALHLAHKTERLRFGCGFNIAPMWHPLRLAEDFATVDHLTQGRVVFGVGRGYHTREVETFGAPMRDPDANRELFEEQIDIIFKAFNEQSFSHQGKYYTLPPKVPYRGYELSELTLVPRPLNRPVECYQPVVSASQRGLDFMAKHGIKGVIGGGAAAGGAAEKTIRAWQDALRRRGRDTELGTDLVIGIMFHIAETEEQAIREASPFFEEWMKMFAPLGFVPGLSDDQIEAIADPARARTTPLPSLRESANRGGFMAGPPELIRDRLLELQERYPGLEQVHVGQVVGTPKRVILEQLETFALEVMPTFKKTPVSVA
ncbi:MAG TPA: LLM class flavin-dependent oxidoreductase [Chloroflexota bacterium]|jgi:alkanesulfonate monooxygenase SsuD/methylene tetrahydromethanopterin reductase-like flavin-dependent oxidoreductase (luciferase family)